VLSTAVALPWPGPGASPPSEDDRIAAVQRAGGSEDSYSNVVTAPQLVSEPSFSL
jgi:hypothetical protein